MKLLKVKMIIWMTSNRMLNKELKNQNLIFGKEIIRMSQVLMEIQKIIDKGAEFVR